MLTLKQLKNNMIDNNQFGRVATRCQMCPCEALTPVLDLGHHPHSDLFPTKTELDDMEPRFPLRLVICSDCKLLQIDYFVNPDYLYRGEYLYQSSTTKTGTSHYHDMAKTIVDRFGFGTIDNLAVDIGSNVGVLLQGFKQEGMSVLGIDPAEVSRKAIDNGIDTIIDYFNLQTAEEITSTHKKASVITGTNVFAHIHELDDAVMGVKHLLREDGVFVVEAPSALELLEHLEYDTIYHQHIGYLSVFPMKRYFERFGMELFDVTKSTIHGGTLRYFVGHKGAHAVLPSVAECIKEEMETGIYDESYLRKFAKKVTEQKVALVELLLQLRKDGKKVVAVSAPAKGNTLLNYCNLDSVFLDFATEKNPLKVGRYTPGTHLEIKNDEAVLEEGADYVLILAWNFAEEIMKNMADFKAGGGKFIIPIPYPKVI